jgi:hypothetical protein
VHRFMRFEDFGSSTRPATVLLIAIMVFIDIR